MDSKNLSAEEIVILKLLSNFINQNGVIEPTIEAPEPEPESLWLANAEPYIPETDILEPKIVPVFTSSRRNLRGYGQNCIVPANTMINLVSIKNNSIITRSDGVATILSPLRVCLPNGSEITSKDFPNTTCIMGYESASKVACFVLPLKTRLQIGVTKMSTNVEYTFTFLPSTHLILCPDAHIRIGAIKAKVENETNIILTRSVFS